MAKWDTLFRLKGATYHLGTMKKLYGEGIATSIQDRHKLKWHLFAFFCELRAAFSLLLQELNEYYDLRIQIEKVEWDTFTKALKDQNKWDGLTKYIREEYEEAEWFKDLREYVNHILHRGNLMPCLMFHSVPAEAIAKKPTYHLERDPKDPGKSRPDDVITDCEGFLDKMQSFINTCHKQLANNS